mgnify:CR=1 FL=1
MDTATIEKKLAALKANLAAAQGTPTEVYSRIVGYYRSVKNWNSGKREEFTRRATYRLPSGVPAARTESLPGAVPVSSRALLREASAECPDLFHGEQAPTLRDVMGPASYLLFTRGTCPNCPAVRAYLEETGLFGKEADVDTPEGLELAREYGVLSCPTAVLRDPEDREVYRAYSVTELRAFLETVPQTA